MITFVDLIFSPRGLHGGVVIDKLRRIQGVSSVMGDHDLAFHWETPEEFNDQVRLIHSALRGSEATYRLHTMENGFHGQDQGGMVPSVDTEPSEHPAYTRD